MIVKINNVKWDKSFGNSNDLPTDNIYIVSEIDYTPDDILGGMFFCDVDNCEFEYLEELPEDLIEYIEDNDGNKAYLPYIKNQL